MAVLNPSLHRQIDKETHASTRSHNWRIAAQSSLHLTSFPSIEHESLGFHRSHPSRCGHRLSSFSSFWISLADTAHHFPLLHCPLIKKVVRRITLVNEIDSKYIKFVGKSGSLSMGLSTHEEEVERLSNVVWPTILMKLELQVRFGPEDLNGGLCKSERKDLVAELSGKTQK